MTAALVLIDFQTGFSAPFWGARNNPDAEDKAAQLLARWRRNAAPICHIRHLSTEADSPLHPKTGGADFIAQLAPLNGEPVFEKSVNSAFIGTDLEKHLRTSAIQNLVIAGLTTPHCVSTSARMAANLGFQVTLAHDATAAFTRNAQTGWRDNLPDMPAQAIHDAAISHLHGEFVQARATDDILRDLL